jgi:hypothetical protein
VTTGANEPGSAAAARVFITYRREETAAHAGRLYDAMVARFGEANVFMDVDMAPGVDFVERITEAVAACHVLIVVMGPSWATVADERGTARLADPEDFVRLEVETALRRPDVTPIPVLVAGARMPNREELPPELRAITRRNALELSDQRWRYDVGRLISTLDQLLAEMPVVGGPPSRERSVATTGKAAPADAAPGAGETAPPSMVAAATSSKSKPAAPTAGGWRRLRWVLAGAAAIAAIVVAVVLTADGGGGNGAADGGGDTSASQQTGDSQALLNSLPASIRGICRNQQTPDQQWMVKESEPPALAQVNCESEDVGNDYLTYGRWESPTKARDWLKNEKEIYSSSSADACRSSTNTEMKTTLPQAERGCVDIVEEGDSATGILMAWNEDQSPVVGWFQSVDKHNQEAALKKWEDVVTAP